MSHKSAHSDGETQHQQWFTATVGKTPAHSSAVPLFMKILEDKILSFDNWKQPWTFYDFVSADKTLTERDLILFSEIWKKASDFELWNTGDLIAGCKASQTLIANHYNLTDKAIAHIVRAISYQWR